MGQNKTKQDKTTKALEMVFRFSWRHENIDYYIGLQTFHLVSKLLQGSQDFKFCQGW